MLDLTGKVALVTGASGGIGSSIAKQLHALGAYVHISGSNEEKLKQLSEELSKLQENRHEIRICNLSDVEACGALVSSMPHIDILVCNAGITNDTLAIRMSNEMFDQVININLKANFILNREAIKKMIKYRYGRIINISSVVGISGNAGQANYCASKAGLIGMTKALAQEVATRGITVNAIAPGFIETDMTAKLSIEQKEAILQKIPTKTLGSPQDIAAMVVFLASDRATYITGQTMHINGGMLMI